MTPPGDTPRLAIDLRLARKTPLFLAQDLSASVAYGRTDLERILPHRNKFLLVDEVLGLDLEKKRIAGVRNLRAADPVFEDHFPGFPVYPGVLLIETAGQLALCLATFLAAGVFEIGSEWTPRPVRLLRIRDVAFIAEARPGDQLTVLAQTLDEGGLTFVAVGQILRGDTVICVAVLEALTGDAL